MADHKDDDPLMSADRVRRCFGTRPGQDILARYHDEEWGCCCMMTGICSRR